MRDCVSLSVFCISTLLVRQRPCRAAHHALPATHAAGGSHRQIVVKRNSRLVSLAAPREHKVMPDFVAAPDAAIAKNACFMVHGNGQRGIVMPSSRRAPREWRTLYLCLRRQPFQFAIPG